MADEHRPHDCEEHEDQPERSLEEALRLYETVAEAQEPGVRRSPFKFLDAYGLEDSDIFFGRDFEIDELLWHFYRRRHLVLYGESGAGKSSLVACGLASRLPAEDAFIVSLRCHEAPLYTAVKQLLSLLPDGAGPELPAEDAAGRLAAAAVAASQALNRTLVLLFDQFEELFLFQPPEIRSAFARELAELLRVRADIKVLVVVRQEYLAQLSELESHVPDLFENRMWLRRMSAESAAAAVRQACAVCGVQVEADLAEHVAERLATDGRGVELPYLQVVMDRLYRQALAGIAPEAGLEARPVLSHEAYQGLGELQDILARFLEEEVTELSDQDAGRQVLKAMITSDGTSRVLDRPNLAQEVLNFGEAIDGGKLDTLLRELVDERILRAEADGRLLQLRHDALAKTVHAWMTGLEKELMEVREALRGRFREYQARERAPEALLDAGFLAYLAPYESRLALTAELGDFVSSSKSAMIRRQRRRRIALAVSIASAFVILVVFTLWNLAERERAEQYALEARNSVASVFAQNGNKAREETAWDKALLYYRRSLERQDNMVARVGSRDALTRARAELSVLRGHNESIQSVAFSPDGRTIAAISPFGTTWLWDLGTWQVTALPLHYRFTSVNANSVVFHPNGRILVHDGTRFGGIHLWDLETGTKQKVLRVGNDHDSSSVAVSPDGRNIASGSQDKTIRLWDVETGRERAVLRGHEGIVTSVAFSPDGRTLASGSSDATIRLWDVETEKELTMNSLGSSHNDGVTSLAFSPDGQTLAVGSWAGPIYLWKWDKGRLEYSETLDGHAQNITSVAFSPDGRTIASGSEDTTIRLWDLRTQKLLTILRGHIDPVNSVAFSPDGQTLASGSDDMTIKLWDLASGWNDHWTHSFPFSTSPDGRVLAGLIAGTIRLWDVDGGDILAELERVDGDDALSIHTGPNGKAIVWTSKDMAIRLWNRESVTVLLESKDYTNDLHELQAKSEPWLAHQFKESHYSHYFNAKTKEDQAEPKKSRSYWHRFNVNTEEPPENDAKGILLADAMADAMSNRLREVEAAPFEAGDNSEVSIIEPSIKRDHAVTFSPDGRTIVVKGPNDLFRLFDRDNGQELAFIKGRNDYVTSVAFSPDGRTLAVGSIDGFIRLWDRDSFQPLTLLRGHSSEAISVTFSPDGRTIASGSEDGTIRLWGLDNSQEMAVLKGHQARVLSVAFSPDGQTVASGSEDRTIRLWDPNSGQEPTILRGHADSVTSVAFNPDGSIILSASWDRTIRLWGRDSGQEVIALEGRPDYPVEGIDFNPDGRTSIAKPFGINSYLDMAPDKELVEQLTVFTSVGLSFDLDANGFLIWKDPVALAQARLDAAKAGRIWWRLDGGKSLVPLYVNELAQAKAQAMKQ